MKNTIHIRFIIYFNNKYQKLVTFTDGQSVSRSSSASQLPRIAAFRASYKNKILQTHKSTKRKGSSRLFVKCVLKCTSLRLPNVEGCSRLATSKWIWSGNKLSEGEAVSCLSRKVRELETAIQVWMSRRERMILLGSRLKSLSWFFAKVGALMAVRPIRVCV